MEKELMSFFEKFIRSPSIFLNKTTLLSNYIPHSIPHRTDQVQQLASILAPTLKLERPSNIFVYGKTGTGKTVTVNFVVKQITDLSVQRSIPIRVFYVNCRLKKVADTEYRLLTQLIQELGKSVPITGLPTDEVYKIFFDAVEGEKQSLIIILDEIDQLIKKAGDSILYNLTRINTELKNSRISMIGISNDITFINDIDPRIKSSLSEEEVIFPPYNALQLQQILSERAALAFRKEAVGEGLIEKCAAYAAREHGDARRAIDLLRIAAEVAERQGKSRIAVEDLDQAEEKMERDRVLDIVKAQPRQSQLTLYALLQLSRQRKDAIYTGDVYHLYKQLSASTDLRPLTQRRISDIISELDMLGIIAVRVISKGRYGKTREISVSISEEMQAKVQALLRQEMDIP
ncbi:MAG TPA: ORC1-type DNA replication protein [Candidatus Nanoarchaeia archaeon]|nr:ORC1-type DNA replication protein [Candidatus Nanoarchaeia archaeon]